MGIFDLLWGPLAIIDPSSNYEEMLDKIKSNKEGTINDCESVDSGQYSNVIMTNLVNDVDGSVDPEDNFNSLVIDIKNDFDNDSEADDTEGLNSVDSDVD